ncbi:SbcC/MukB-like Walker B domain-containing protein [Kribbella sp. NPDC023972]|uniref:ATP-binding protein n=1 Tax=Kribbella sp. NPDC023972 TaxID=3154795 RepID=UPI0033E2A152
MKTPPVVLQSRAPAEGTPEQFRITKVQLLNWGRYSNLETMLVGRAGTAILGPTGAGKSQILDAIAAVLMPNPQEFNQAARDDRGRKAERTVYSYARGKTDQILDSNRHSSSTAYLRPPGTEFPSGVAVTWATGDGQIVTAARLVWVSKDTSTLDEITSGTVYAFIQDDFDLQRLNELRPTRAASSPVTQASLEKLVILPRDLVTTSQPSMHARMRRVMGIGSTEESQKLALTLLRRAQSSKGIFSINDLFKQFVLTEPLALQRWDIALAAYREASALYEVFETARKRHDALEEVPGLARRYAAAGQDATVKRQLLRPLSGEEATRVEIWHAEKIIGWITRAIEDNRIAEAVAREDVGTATALATAARDRWGDVMQQITAAGGDRSQSLKSQAEAQRALLRSIEATRAPVARRLEEVGLRMPDSVGDMSLLLTEIGTKLAALKAEKKAVDPVSADHNGLVWDLKKRIRETERQLENARRRSTNIPDHAAIRRSTIAAGTRVTEAELPYAGELIRIRSEHRQWEKAIVKVLGAMASDLLVAEADWRDVTRFVDANDMRGRIVLTPAQERQHARRSPIPGTVPAMIEIAPDSPYCGWLLDELIEHHSYLCVASPDDLRSPRPQGAKGAVTRAGMLTGVRGRVIKDDRATPYTWIGWDNAALVGQLSSTVEALHREHHEADKTATKTMQQRDRLQNQIATLEDLQNTRWSELDTSPARQRITELTEQLKQLAATQPEIDKLSKELERHHEDEIAAGRKVVEAQGRVDALNEEWGELYVIEDQVKDLIDDNTALTDDERVYLAPLPFAAPATSQSINDPLDHATGLLVAQIEQHDKDRAGHQSHLTTIFGHYKQLDDKAEIDQTIESLPTVLAIYEALTTDDLPRAKNAWLEKVGADMNDSLHKLLVQIEDDGKSIRRGLQPINDVLTGVEFRDKSALAIDTVDRPSSDLRDFRKTLTAYTSNILGRDDANLEKSFVKLQGELKRLEERSRAGDSWRRRVFDAREHVEFRAIETRPDGKTLVHEGVAGMSGGEGQELIAFILGAALRYRLGDGSTRVPTYAPIVLDEGFVKADANYTGRALDALRALGFQLIIGAPREKVTAFEDHVETVAYISADADRPGSVRIYPLTIEEAVQLQRAGAEPAGSL